VIHIPFVIAVYTTSQRIVFLCPFLLRSADLAELAKQEDKLNDQERQLLRQLINQHQGQGQAAGGAATSGKSSVGTAAGNPRGSSSR
jgi:hypothetical protein